LRRVRSRALRAASRARAASIWFCHYAVVTLDQIISFPSTEPSRERSMFKPSATDSNPRKTASAKVGTIREHRRSENGPNHPTQS
jgi:hypothetical protein